MYEIIEKRNLSEAIIRMEIKAERIAASCLPGQFIIVKIDEYGERIPLTICDYQRDKKVVTIVFQIVGASTLRLSRLRKGEKLRDVAGPLGKPCEWLSEPLEELSKKNILFVAGGVGTAPVYPQVKWLKEHGILADCVIGARNKGLLLFTEEMKAVTKNLYLTTDDGSFGFHGNVNDRIKALVKDEKKEYDLVVAIGPMIMMKYVCLLTKELGIKTIVSMNPIMVDGTGMCGACRVSVGGEVKFACVDGPEFDGHLVDFDQAMKRQRMYQTEEGKRYLKEQEGATHHGGCGQCQ